MDDNNEYPIPEEENEETTGGVDSSSNKYVYFRGRSLRTTGKSRSRYDGYDDRVQIDYSKSLGENIRDALAGSLNVVVNEDGGGGANPANKQLRISHLNNLARLVVSENFYYTTTPTTIPGKFGGGQQKNGQKNVSTTTTGGGSGGNNSSPEVVTFEQLLLCLRCLLTDEEREIRAATLRVLRYLIQTEDDLAAALSLRLDVLIARCLDMLLDNRLERSLCMRLMVSLIDRCPSTFPASLVQCLLAVSLDGYEERDKLARAATAALCELAIRNHDLVLNCGGLGWLVRSILMGGQSSPRLAECMTTVLTNIYNQPGCRRRYACMLRNVFYDLLAPLMDEQFKLSGLDVDEKSVQIKCETNQVLDNCRFAVVAALRAWPGMIGYFSYSTGCGYNGSFLPSPIHALVASLCLDSATIHDFSIDIICKILNVPYQDQQIESWDRALEVADFIEWQEFKYSLSQDFANADADTILGDWNAKRRPCLTTQRKALVLLGLVDSGLINALVNLVIANPNGPLEVKVTLLLSDILDMSGRWLPSIYRHLTLCMASLLNMVYYDDVGDENEKDGGGRMKRAEAAQRTAPLAAEVQRQNANLLAHRLRVLSSNRQRPKRVRTLQMENLLAKFGSAAAARCSGGPAHRGGGGGDEPPTSTQRTLTTRTGSGQKTRSVSVPVDAVRPLPSKLSSADRVHDLIRDSRTTVPYSNHTAWDWSLVYLALCQMCQHRHHFEDSTCHKFTSQLIQFFDPAGGQFCRMTDDYWSYSRVGCVLMRVLGGAPSESQMAAQLKAFLAHLLPNFLPDRLHVGLLSSKNIHNNSCADYFLFIGQLSDTESGRLLMERSGLAQRLVDLINIDAQDSYIKLIVSSMCDYDRPAIGRVLLQKALTGAKATARLYATKFLSVLGKLKVSGFADWGMELLINQLRDANRSVVEEAVSGIGQLINAADYLNALIRMRPSLLPLGDAGVLLLTYTMSSEQAVSMMIKQQQGQSSSSDQNSFVGKEIERWKSTFNARYALIVDERLCEALSGYRRLPDGSFPRHASTELQVSTDVYLPPHLYGQLAGHTVGCELLQTYGCLEPLLVDLHTRALEKPEDVLAMKAAMWALGHVYSSQLGSKLLPSSMVGSLVKMAEECPVLSLRGCAYYVLNLIVQSGPSVRRRLRHLAWEACPPYPPPPPPPSGNSSSAPAECSQSPRRLDQPQQDPGGSCLPPLLSASMTSGGSGSGVGVGGDLVFSTSPPAAPADAQIGAPLMMMSASRKSSSSQYQYQQQQARSYHSASSGASAGYHHHYHPYHYNNQQQQQQSELLDSGSIMTCGSCELCRWSSPSAGPPGASCGASTASTATTTAGLLGGGGDNYFFPERIKIHCCEDDELKIISPPPSSTNRNHQAAEAAEGAEDTPDLLPMIRTARSSSSLSSSRNTLLPTMAAGNVKRQSTPSPQHHPNHHYHQQAEIRKISVPAKLERFNFGSGGDKDKDKGDKDYNNHHHQEREEGDDLEFGGPMRPYPPYQQQREIQDPGTVGFFDRVRKRSDSVSEFMRSAFGLRKSAGLPEDLPALAGGGSYWWRKVVGKEAGDDEKWSLSLSGVVIRQKEKNQRRQCEYMTEENAAGFQAWRMLQSDRAKWGRRSSGDGLGVGPVAVGRVEVSGGGKASAQQLTRVESRTSRLGLVEDQLLLADEDPSVSIRGDQSPTIQRMRLGPITDNDRVDEDIPGGGDKPVFLCLPLDIGLICNVTDWPSESRTDNGIAQAQRSSESQYPAIDHLEELCLHCRPLGSRGGESKDRSSDQSSFRKELLRLVSSLSVRRKYAEQGLLRLKQEAPQVFRSLCVYSDVSHIMSVFTLRLSARRFIQELFVDVDFGELWLEPRRSVHLLDQRHHRTPSAPAAPLIT